MLNKEKDLPIMLTRISGTVMIILCHIIGYYTFLPGHEFLGEVFNVGVFIFIIISGRLFGKKHISDISKWLSGRFKKIFLPSLIVCIFTISALFFAGQKLDIPSVMMYLTQLQGVVFIFPFLLPKSIHEIPGLGPLWFVTVIILCYLLVPLIQTTLNKKRMGKEGLAFFGISIILLTIVFLALQLLFKISLFYFVVFFMGYGIGFWELDKHRGHFSFIVITAVNFLMQLGRLWLLSRETFPEPIYRISVLITHTVFAIWIYAFFIELNMLFPVFVEKLCSLKILNAFEKISFFVYLVHGIFCMGIFNVYKLLDNLFVSTLVFFASTIVSAIIIKFISDLVTGCFSTRKKLKKKS